MDLITELREKTRDNPKRIVFPEGNDQKILKAAGLLAAEGIAIPILLGIKDELMSQGTHAGVDMKGIRMVDPLTSPRLEEYVASYCRMRDFPSGAAIRILRQPLYFGAMMVRQDEADTMVAGVASATEDIIMASELIIGLQEGVSTPSSFFVMDVPSYSGREGNLLIFADAAVNPDPTPEQLADIAVATAGSATKLLGWEPRVAMLSFSTKGSAVHPLVDKVVKAVEILKKQAPGLAVDGELQADAAIIPEVARRKIKGRSQVAGIANVLIFPNLDAANIAYKLVQRLAGAKAYGPLLQGFAKPVTDLSRGASIEDILGTAMLMVRIAQAL
jgi:phosphate acetyltransferase